MTIVPLYSSPSDVSNLITGNRPQFSVLQLNIQSVRGQKDVLQVFFREFRFLFSVVMLTETWISDVSDFFSLEGYVSFYLSRNDRRGGGVCLFVTEKMQCQTIDELTVLTPDYEVLSVCSGKLMLTVVYRPPDGNVNNLFDFMERLFQRSIDCDSSLFIGGDFNIDMNEKSPRSSRLSILVLSYSLINVAQYLPA